ncbi:CvpA family protein [Roseomonas sp. NAR14]|uniref:CvpA family protein n=1 Tax=Roseomonas acroporae TaxID=2937791 RepID=A0A9X2BSW9_9PROT|nr:CvpA family protein [Roseomonas acroporae]MCK8783988.1 CvpA family protein [Roseomonas acroporae]
MTWVDGAVLAVLAVSALLAFLRGFVSEVLGIGAWVGAALAGLAARPSLQPRLEPYIDPPWLAGVVAGAIVFLVVLVVLKVIISVVAGLVQDSVLGGPDRALGLVFGIARGALLVVVAYIAAVHFIPATERWPEAVLQSRSLPLAADGASWLVAQLPPDIRPQLGLPPGSAPGAPPGGQAPSADDLFRPPARNRL